MLSIRRPEHCCTGLAGTKDGSTPSPRVRLDVRSRKCLHSLDLPDPRTWALAVDPHGRYLYTAGNDRLVRRWVLGDLSRPPVCDTAFEPLPDGNWVIWSDPDGPNRHWVNHSEGATRWLGWHAPLSDGSRWGHRPMGTYTPPARR